MFRLGAITFKREQSPLQRVESCSLISGTDLLQEAVGVMTPQGTCKAVDACRQLPTITKTVKSVTYKQHYCGFEQAFQPCNTREINEY